MTVRQPVVFYSGDRIIPATFPVCLVK